MARMRLKFQASASDDWLASVSADHPEAEIKLLASLPTGDGLLGALELQYQDADAFVDRFETDSEVYSYDVLHADGQFRVIRYLIMTPEGYGGLRKSGIPPHFPARMRNGWLFTELTGSQDQLSQLIDELREADMPHQVESLNQMHHSTDLLTERQREIILTAVDKGYYDSPRRCTLSDIADTFDVAKSAASGVLHRAEGRIIKEFVGKWHSDPGNSPNNPN